MGMASKLLEVSMKVFLTAESSEFFQFRASQEKQERPKWSLRFANASSSCHLDSLPAPSWQTLEPQDTKGSRSIVGLRALLLMGGESIEVDQPWIVGIGRRLELPTTMNLHQGLHAPGV